MCYFQVRKDLGEEVRLNKKEKRREGSSFLLTKNFLERKSIYKLQKLKKQLKKEKQVAQSPDPPLVNLKPTNRGHYDHCDIVNITIYVSSSTLPTIINVGIFCVQFNLAKL